MDKLTITLPTETWRGHRTKWPIDSANVTSENFTSGSKNLDTNVNGMITKRPGGFDYNVNPFTHPAADQYEAIFEDGIHHLLTVQGGTVQYTSGSGIITPVQSGYSPNGNFEFALTQDRVYFGNGIDNPQVYDRTTSYGGVTYTVPKTRDMGAQAPVSAPTFAADSSGGSVPAGGHTYKITFLYYDEAESNGGPASGLHTVSDPDNTVNLTAIPIGGYGVTARKIYRDDNDGNWLLVGTINDNTTTIFADTASIGTSAVPTSNDLPPLFSLIALYLDRLFVAGVAGRPSDLFWSQAGIPDVFDLTDFFVTCDSSSPIVGLLVYNNTQLLVFNRRSIGKIIGLDSGTFRYVPIPGSVGCADNRSIQIRTLKGIPVVVWLSDKGVYSYNGQSVDYISEDIEDLINFNIQQSQQTKGQVTQDTTTDFEAGTPSGGIVISGGTVSTISPKRLWQSESDWEGGSSLTNISTHDGTNELTIPSAFDEPLSTGSVSGLNSDDSAGLTIPTISDFTGETTPTAFYGILAFQSSPLPDAVAHSFVPPHDGVLTSFRYHIWVPSADSATITFTVWSDALGSPGSVIYSSSHTYGPTDSDQTVNPNISLSGGTRYWLGVQGPNTLAPSTNGVLASFPTGGAVKVRQGGTWGTADASQFQHGTSNVNYTFTQNAISASGTWTSAPADTFSDSISTGIILSVAASYPASTSASIVVQGTNDNPTMSPTWHTTDTLSSPNGNTSLSGSGYRYWRMIATLSTTDNRSTPTVHGPVLRFATVGTWISEVIDTTVDMVSYDNFNSNTNVPSGTDASGFVASSDDGVTFTPYTDFSSVPRKRYFKVKWVLTASSDDETVPAVLNTEFDWSIVSTFISSAIDLGATPAGWSIFQSSFAANGGTVSFAVRTAANQSGLAAASWVFVTNGQFITADIHPWIQYRIIISSHANEVPIIDSVTINWFIQIVNSIRVASIFFNRSYYLAAALFNSLTNNILVKLDEYNNWTVYEDITINTFSFFFNIPYYGSATIGKLIVFDNGLTDSGTAITMDVRSVLKLGARAPNDMDDRVKVFRDLRAIVKGTGAQYYFYYSVDRGNTWLPLFDVNTGLTYFQPPSDNGVYVCRMSVTADSLNPSGRQIMIRCVESTVNYAEIHSMKARVWIRQQEVLTENA